MTRRTARTTAILMWIIAMGAAVTAAALLLTDHAADSDAPALETAVILSIIVAFATTGLALVFRVPENRISWLYLTAGVAGGMWMVLRMYAYAALSQGWPGGSYSGTLSYAVYTPWILLMVALPMLLFPDGRLPSPRWRWVVWVISTWMALHVLLALFAGPPPGHDFDHLRGPLQSEAGRQIALSLLPLLVPLFMVLTASSLLGSASALVVRFRRAEGVERQQLKWLALAASVAGVGLAFVYTVGDYLFTDPAWRGPIVIGALLAVLGIPIATGLAIVKYRLYDIDRLISRTLNYGLLVVCLAGVYVAGVFVVGAVVPGDDNISVALSTLAVAALFNPARRKLQVVIDRRFFRARYDAQEVINRLSDGLQDEVDLAIIEEELLDAVDETVKPETSALWIRRS